MEVTSTRLPEIKIIKPEVFEDERGFFFECFHQQRFEEAIGCSVTFVQDNQSKSSRGVLRGLHYQLSPKQQGKLVRVIQGEIFDVAVDIRKSFSTFGQWVGEILSAENKKQIWIPQGFAHGFITLSETSELLYKITNYYAPEYERSIRWDDAVIGIEWPKGLALRTSLKDAEAIALQQAEVFE